MLSCHLTQKLLKVHQRRHHGWGRGQTMFNLIISFRFCPADQLALNDVLHQRNNLQAFERRWRRRRGKKLNTETIKN